MRRRARIYRHRHFGGYFSYCVRTVTAKRGCGPIAACPLIIKAWFGC